MTLDTVLSILVLAIIALLIGAALLWRRGGQQRQVVDGFDRLRALAPSPRHIVPGHDPEVMRRYPAVPGLEGIAVELHRDPSA